jgi:hypothetical protein
VEAFEVKPALFDICYKIAQSHVPIAHPNMKITEEMINEVRLLRNKNLTYAQIGAKLGASTNAV